MQITLRSVKRPGVTLDDGVTDNIARVRVTATAGGQRARIDPLNLNDAKSGTFSMALPSGASGTLALDVEGADATGLVVAAGQAVVMDSSSTQSVQIGMAPCSHASMCWKGLGPSGGFLTRVWAISPTDVWAIGNPNVAIHWDGQIWHPAKGLPTNYSLSALWASGANDVWIGADNGVFYFDGVNFNPATGISDKDRIISIHGFDSNHIFVGTVNGLYYGNRTAFTKIPNTTGEVRSIWAISSDTAFVIGEQNLICKKFTCTKILSDAVLMGLPNPLVLRGVWAISDSEWWIVGDSVFIHSDGMGDPKKYTGNGDRWSVWGSVSNDVWIAGQDNASPSLWHWDGQTLTPNHPGSPGWTAMPTLQSVTSVTGSSSKDVWAVGQEGMIVHWDGTQLRLSGMIQADPFADGSGIKETDGSHGIWGNEEMIFGLQETDERITILLAL